MGCPTENKKRENFIKKAHEIYQALYGDCNLALSSGLIVKVISWFNLFPNSIQNKSQFS